MKKAHEASFNHRLKSQRLLHSWTQEQVAEQIGTTRVNISRWESGTVQPSLYFRQRLYNLFDRSAAELGLDQDNMENGDNSISSLLPSQEKLLSADLASLPCWNVPYQRNPLFTGREEILTCLYHALHPEMSTALPQPQAISGLGGTGKTQAAIEYVYRYKDDYNVVLWARAENHDTLTTDFVSFASLLQLPEKDEQQQYRILEAVKYWLNNNSNWLLILDNLEDFVMIRDFLPVQSKGHIVLTTRVQATGQFVQRITLEPMNINESTLFLLRRAKFLRHNAILEEASESLCAEARDVSQMLDGLPLALDQAGAYIEESGCSISDYLVRYNIYQARLLHRRGHFSEDHPASVGTTFSLCFEKVRQRHPAAAELLQLCAFLAPDAIPEGMIRMGSSELCPVLHELAADPIAFDDALAMLRMSSLLSRNAKTHTLSIHRLVQVILKEKMDEEIQRQWVEIVIQMLNRAFPPAKEHTMWPLCQQYLPHVEAGIQLIEQWKIQSQEVGHLLAQVGVYLRERGSYAQAETLLSRAVAIQTQVLGEETEVVAAILHDLALLYYYQGNYMRSEQLYLRVLYIREQILAPDHPDRGSLLNDLAVLYEHQGRYQEAEVLYVQALAFAKQYQHIHPQQLMDVLNNLALLHFYQGRYQEAEHLYIQALALEEQQEHIHPHLGVTLNNFGLLCFSQKRYQEAELLYQRSLAIRKQYFGSEHPEVAISLSNLARLYLDQGQCVEAESLYQHSLTIREQYFGSEHPEVAISLNGLGRLYFLQHRFQEAELLYQRALSIREKQLGPEHLDTAKSLDGLALLYAQQEKYEESELLSERVLDIYEKFLAPTDTRITQVIERLTELSRKQGKHSQAEMFFHRIVQLQEQKEHFHDGQTQ